MNQVQKKRWIKFYNHVSQPQDKWAHKEFNFGVFNAIKDYEEALDFPFGQICGTVGCLAGEFPKVFKNWRWSGEGVCLTTKRGEMHMDYALIDFFGITEREGDHLFYPGYQDKEIDPYYNSHFILDEEATKEEVVENLRRFLVIKGILND